LLNNKFSKGVIFSCIAAIFWGLPQPLFFNELNHVETIEVVAHRGFWSFIFLFLLLILISNISDFIEIFKSRKRIFILTITAFLIAGNWAGFIYSVGQERVQDASMGYFITPMISIVLGYFFLNEKITKPKFASVCFMLSGILFLFINLNQFPFLIIWIGTSWAIYGLLRKQVNVNPPIGLLYETFIISLISTPYLVYLFWQNENSIFSIDLKTSLFLMKKFYKLS
jgi:chloramphenicol-sensitive protein RarD